MLPRIEAIQGFDQRLAGVDRVRQRIAEIESKFGIGGVGGEDFQSILNKELAKVDKTAPTQNVEKVEKTEKAEKIQKAANVEDSNEIETFGASGDSDKTTKVTPKSSQSARSSANNSRIFPGEDALPDAMNKAINPFAAFATRPSTSMDKVDEEEVETPTRETKRLSFNSNMSTEDMIEAAAEKYDVDSRLVKAVAIAESNMNQNDISDAGAIGVMQLMPETAAGLGVDPYDEQQNIEGGAKYLRQMLDTFGGNVKKAVAAYNAGPGAVQKYGGIPPYGETQHYVGRVMDLYR